MAVKASATITLSFMVDITAVYRYYKMQLSTNAPPATPTTNPPPVEWTDSEPAYNSDGTYTLYVVDLNVFSDGSFIYTPVSVSSSYEAAKSAYNKALAAENTANDAKDTADHIEVGSQNLIEGSRFLNWGDCGYWSSGTMYIVGVGGTDVDSVNGTPSGTYYDTEIVGTEWGCMMPGRASYKNKMVIGEQYTFSCYLWLSTGTNIELFGYEGMGYEPPAPSGYPHEEWFKLSITFTCVTKIENHDNVLVYVANSSGNAYAAFSSPMLVRGNKAADWSLAPSELKTEIDDASKTATNYITYTDGSLMISDMVNPDAQQSGGAVGKNVLINPTDVQIRDNETILASFGPNGIEFDKTVVFAADGLLVNNGDAYSYLGRNTILWSGGTGGYYMHGTQSITLSANITRQISGAVFAWSLYRDGNPVDTDWHFFFVPKHQVVNFGGDVIRMYDAYLGMNKILYVSNGNVTGHDQNSTSGTTNGIAWDNTLWVLRYVVGV